jgi:DNA polymerase III epsilon subunit-like protein
METAWVSIDVETDGTNPMVNNLLSIELYVLTNDKMCLGEYYACVEKLETIVQMKKQWSFGKIIL